MELSLSAKWIERWVLTGMVLCSLLIPAHAENTMTIAHPEFYPFFAENEDGTTRGFFHDIVTQVIEQHMGIPLKWEQMPWTRCQNQVKNGRNDAMITVPTMERLGYSDTHHVPFYLKELKLFTYRGHKRLDQIQAIQSIQDIKSGGYIVVTYSGNGWNKKHITSQGIPTYETSEVYTIWKMLAARRGDLVIEWPVGAGVGIRASGVSDRIVETRVSLEAMPFHLLVSKKSKYTYVLDRFNQVIQDMTADGTIQKIISAYY